LALECMVTPCLAGPEAEKEFCGPITDGSDRVDYEMACEYLARRIANPLQVAAELARYLDERAAVCPFNVGAATYLFAGGCFAAKREFEWR
jgi:hypothetical protein